MLELGIPVGAGTDATRVSSYNPWLSLYWLVTGQDRWRRFAVSRSKSPQPRGGVAALSRREQLVFGRKGKKGAIAVGQLADLAALTDDYLSVPEEKIKGIESVLTIVGGKVVYGAGNSPTLARRRCPYCRNGHP